MSNDPARSRFIAITALRFMGVGLVMLGIAIFQGVVDLPPFVGMIIAVIGLLDIFFMPRFLARRWKTPPQ